MRLLWIEDDLSLRRVLGPLLRAEGYALTEAGDADTARVAARVHPDLVLLDLMLPPTGRAETGLALLDTLLADSPPPRVVVLSGAGGRGAALEAIRRGAYDFLAKPVDPDVLLVVLARARERVHLEREIQHLRSRVLAGGGVLGQSPPFLAALDLADRVAPTDLSVLLTGENGTGKEVLARRIHGASRRAERPFIPINCGALPSTLLESTLFGHTRGAFTGADRARKGLFVEADGGTLFLDEVGDLEPATQVRLLRALEAQEILPVGADRPVRVDVRIVSATNRDLEAARAEGTFRDDLYWRLRGIEIRLPPLRDRGDDILLLARAFLDAAAPGHELGDEARAALLAHPWPGNLRELRHAMQRAAVMAGSRALVTPADLGLAPVASPPDGGTFDAQVAALERRLIQGALDAEGGNRSRAARRLGLSRQGLLNKIGRWA